MDYDCLIVEDSHERMKKFKQFLIGYTYLWCETSEEAIEALIQNNFRIIFLDHDLREEHYAGSFGKGTGQEVADFIGNKNILCESVIIHSLNPVGSENMRKSLEKANKPVCCIPGIWTKYKQFSEVLK